ncbi:SusE domain-containing protein [Mucilaginibacter sp. RS28]|uniref:SusE domain-containing protein n=1 Tax=Mucilaginibacter straminoryzae TaxID=2932774 RepID=A0A9X2BAQ2_9SPHI|nr:SusE domain-containing protein [Mucilaginibacter straminoryzae]MCJ8209027.1 SusE domain-containing protein [Mucilaginibacter straminoryzae]
MKKTLYCLVAGLAALLFITSCKKDKTIKNADVTAVTNLFAPEDAKAVKIPSGASGSVTFEWAQAHASDNGLVLYEVAFDKDGGDFSKPLYTVPSDGNGLYNKLTLSYSDLNKIASIAGAKPEEIAKLIWTVRSSRGVNLTPSTVKRTIMVQRPVGFESPDAVYITGSATEGGTDISKAVKMKKVGEGKFEVYTSLKPGTYQFVDAKTGIIKKYSFNGSRLVEDGETNNSDTKVVKLEVSFNDALFKATEVTRVGLWFSADNKIWFDLTYAGNGTWTADNKPIVFHQESWGRDERYKFRFTFKNADGSTTDQYFGSTNRDNSAATSATSPTYFYMVPVDNSVYDYTFKFNHDFDNKSADIKVMMNADVPAYTHTVTLKQ